MSFKQKFFSAITLAFAIVAFSTFVSAQDKTDNPTPPTKEGKMGKRFAEGKEGKRGKRGHHGGDRKMMRALRGIELTEAQQVQIKSLLENHRNSLAPQKEEIHSLIQKKRDGSITEAETARLTEIHNQRKASSEQLKNTIMGLLTPDQITKLEQMKVEREQRREERKERKNRSETPKTDN